MPRPMTTATARPLSVGRRQVFCGGNGSEPFRNMNRYHLQHRTLVSPAGPTTGPHHYRRADEILAQIEAKNA